MEKTRKKQQTILETCKIIEEIPKELPALHLERKDGEVKKNHFIGKRKPIQYYLQQKKEQQKSDEPDVDKKNVITKQKLEPLQEHIRFFLIQYPEKLLSNDKKKFKIKVGFWYDNKKHFKNIKFGVQGKKDYIDDKDLNTKNKVMKYLKDYAHPLHSNYWRCQLLNGEGDLKNNYIDILQKLIV